VTAADAPDAGVRRVVLDDCVPRTILRHLSSLDVRRVEDYGWADEDDGPLLSLTIVLRAHSNRLKDLLPLVRRDPPQSLARTFYAL
jgi:hypothetical protein